MNSKELKTHSMNMFEAVYDRAEKEIIAHLADEKHQGFGEMTEKVASELSAPLPLVKEIARAYIVGRGDIEIVKGPGGGMRLKKSAEVKPVPIPVIEPKAIAVIQEQIKEIKIEDKVEAAPIDLEEAIKTLEPEEKKEEKPKDENELPAWCVAPIDPVRSRLERSREWK